MRSLFTLLLLALTIGSCRQPDTVTPDTLTGTWVEKSARQDTLIFNPTFQGKISTNTLTVNRGRELNSGGYLTPKIGSGMYSYEIANNRISVVSMFSSSLKRSDYAIDPRGNELHIENFFELGFNQPATAIRTLIRLR